MKQVVKDVPGLIGAILFGFTVFHAWDISTMVKRHTYTHRGGFFVQAAALFGFIYVVTIMTWRILRFIVSLLEVFGIYWLVDNSLAVGIATITSAIMLFIGIRIVDNIRNVASKASWHNFMGIPKEN